MANLIIYNRAIQLLTFHPDWVDGCPGCPGPIEPLLMRAQGFLLRDIAGVLKQPKLAEQLRQLGRSMVVKSSGRSEKSLIVKSYDNDFDPMNPNRWKELFVSITGGKIPVVPEREPGPYGILNVPNYLNHLLMAEAIQTITSLVSDKILATTLRNIAGELSKDAFEQGRKAWII